MQPTFSDHFGAKSSDYAGYRPKYPPQLFDWLAALCPARDLAWDCGAGTGQASLELARHFQRVVASDASAGQIAAATPHPRVEYRVAGAEASGLPDGSADLVVVAQALHWFDLERFYREVRRVAKDNAVLAIWSYGVIHVDDPQVDRVLQAFYRDEVGPYWPPERRHVETGYRDLPFPFPETDAPPFAMHAAWTLDQLLGYVRTWSATTRYEQEHFRDPVPGLAARLGALWGKAAQVRTVEWPLVLRVGRCNAPD